MLSVIGLNIAYTLLMPSVSLSGHLGGALGGLIGMFMVPSKNLRVPTAVRVVVSVLWLCSWRIWAIFWSSWIAVDLFVRVKMSSVPLFGTEPIAFGSGVLFHEGESSPLLKTLTVLVAREMAV